MNLSQFTGTRAFGRAYQAMLERDAHPQGSVDRVLKSTMVRLCRETADFLYRSFSPLDLRYVPGTRPQLEAILRSVCPRDCGAEEQLGAIIEFTRRLGERAEQNLQKMRVGGTEEEIIERGSDWCTDVARAACVLSQVAGFPCRIAYLFDLGQAYSGHVIVEAYRAGHWGAPDSSTGIVYATAAGRPVPVWELMNRPELVEAHRGNPRASYSKPEQFRAAGIANYSVWASLHYDYTVTGLNEYYLSILSMSNKGWPGGLRWLHGEDACALQP